MIALAAALACMASATVARVAGAATQGSPPISQTSEFTVDEAVGNCGGFHIIASGSGLLRETLYFDNDGLPARLNVHGRYSGTLTNSSTGKTVADAPSIINIFVDLQGQTETYVGQFFNINIPGEGTVALEVGRYTVEAGGNITFIRGQFQVSEGGLAVLCSALR